MADSVLAWSEQTLGSFPQLSKFVTESNEYLTSKLWHQLTVAIDELFASDEFKSLSSSLSIHDFFVNFIQPLAEHLDPYRFVQFATHTAYSLSPAEAIPFLKDLKPLIKEDELDSTLLIDSAIAYFTVLNGDIFPALDILVSVKSRMDSTASVIAHPTHALYHRAHAIVDEKRNRNTDAYNHRLSFLTYTPFHDLSIEVQRDLAREIAMSAILSDTVFNFGEFLRYDIVKSLDDESGLLEVLQSMNNGDITRFKQFLTSSPLFVGDQAPFAQHSTFLQQKIAIIALMNEVFRRASSQRTLSFREVADITQVPFDHVEFLIIKAIGLGVIRGSIDAVAKRISITWVQPRLLNAQQLVELGDALQVSLDNTRDNIKLVVDSIAKANTVQPPQ